MILLDFDYIINNNINPKFFKKFSKLFSSSKNKFYKKGLILNLQSDVYNKLQDKDVTLRRKIINELQDNNVVSILVLSIENNKKKINFNVDNVFVKNIKKILEICYQNFPHDYTLKVNLKLNDKNFESFSSQILNYFSFPIIKDLTMSFYRENNIQKQNDYNQALILFDELLENFTQIMDRNKHIFTCQIFVKIIRKGIEKLKASNSIVFENGNKFSGFEISSKFQIHKIETYKNYPLITLTLDDSMNKNNVGNSDTVDVVYSKYTFHTHPRKTYDSFEVKYAWPSWHDFESFIVLFKHNFTIFHIVSTLEGVYLLKVNPAIMKSLDNFNDKDLQKICKEFFSISYISYRKDRQELNKKLPQNPQEFCKFINSLTFNYKKQNYPSLFNLEFYDWNNFKDNIVSKIDFFSEGINCPVSDIQN